MVKRTEEQQLMLRIERRLMKGIVDYGLIEDGDHLLVGLSGGKDSLALTELLARRARIYRPRFTLTAVHVAARNSLPPPTNWVATRLPWGTTWTTSS